MPAAAAPPLPHGPLARAAAPLCATGLALHAASAAVSIAGMNAGLLLLAAGLAAALLGGRRPAPTPLDAPLLAVLVVCLASELVADGGPPDLGHATLWRAALGFWLCWQALSLASAPGRAARRALSLAAAGLALAASVGAIQFFTPFDPVHLLGLRAVPFTVVAPGLLGHQAAVGFFVSRLTFGNAALVLVALLAGALLGGAARGGQRALFAAAAGLGLGALVLTFERAAWLGLLAAAAALGAVHLLRRPGGEGAGGGRAPARARTGRLRAGLLCLALFGCALLAWPPARGRLASAFDPAQNRDRVFLWSRALEVVRDHPLLGVGFGNYPRVCGRYYDRVDPSFEMRTWAHNSELSLLAETGPLGLGAGLWLLWRCLRALRARLRDGAPYASGALAASVGLLVVAQVHDVLYDTKVMHPLWLALALGMHPALAAGDRPARS